ncbi:MAG: hypothetical protein JO153_05275 [Solirubrobacterales bacterium]|nr:hypothetical protein [Solirubrobacterales bacterium]
MGNNQSMVGELLSFPVRAGLFPIRAGLRITRVALHTGLTASARTLELMSSALEAVTPEREQRDREWSAPTAGIATATPPAAYPAADGDELVTEAAPEPEPSPFTATAPPPPSTTPPAPIIEEPAHVSEEPTLVEEFAEPGAEDGAGASVTIDEPWDGYSSMKAKHIRPRLEDATPAELAAVQLYEGAHRRRESVLSMVESELRRKSGGPAPAADQARKEETS